MTEAQFISEIQHEMTGSGSLPVVLEEPEIKRLIDQSSRWFFENYGDAVEVEHYVIEKKAFNNPQFKQNRQIILPECVVSVYQFKEINGVGRLGNIDRDFAEDRLIASEIFLSSFHGDDLVMRTAQYQYFDLAKAFFLEQIAYDFNRNTHKLKVLGRDPKFDMYIEAYVKIPMNKLYDDFYFLRYVTAKSKISLARILGMYQFPLPGNVTVNADMLRDEGKEELEWVLQRIDEENTPSWFFMYHLSPLSIVIASLLFMPQIGIFTILGYFGYLLYKNKKKINSIYQNVKKILNNIKHFTKIKPLEFKIY